ncbi:MAG: aspartate/glutamate racemase family protein [Proteobacteria bacterium]|nr:aspartate/glutamate racemase family protein [Pseudomonadota bacterium]
MVNKILIINPNSSKSVTKNMAQELTKPCLALNIDIEYATIDQAPEVIESAEEVEIAHRLTVDYVIQSQADAYVIACFCDPGVAELRAAGYQNVFGIGESAMHMASLISPKFGIISIMEPSIKRHIEQVERAGLTPKLAGDLALDLGGLELANIKRARPRIEAVARRLRDEHGAGSLILGCAGMGIHRAWLQGLLNIPIIDPCWAGVAMAAGALGILKNN